MPAGYKPHIYSLTSFRPTSVHGDKVKTESNRPRAKMLLVYVGAGDRSNQPKIEIQRQ